MTTKELSSMTNKNNIDKNLVYVSLNIRQYSAFSHLASHMQNWQMALRASSMSAKISNLAPNLRLHHSANFSASNASTRMPLSATGKVHKRQRCCDLNIIALCEFQD
jgi:hypothetical protein